METSGFYSNFLRLCQEKGVNPTFVVSQIGLSKPNATYWKNGTIPKDDTLRKLADYFGVTVRALIDDSEELRDEQKRAFIERCKTLDETLDDADKMLSFGDADYLKKIIDGRTKATQDCVESLAADLGIKVAYLLGVSDDPVDSKIKEGSHFADEIDYILTTIHIRKLVEEDLHQKCSAEDAEAVAAVIFDFIRPENLIPLGWAFDAMMNREYDPGETNMWNSMLFAFIQFYYSRFGRLNRLRTVADDKQVFIRPAIFEKKGQKDYYCLVPYDGDEVLGSGDMTLDELELFLVNYDPAKNNPPQDQEDPRTE